MIELPKKKIKASVQSPRNLIIMSKPKVGKTELIAGLDNCLHLDFEYGTDYVESMKMTVIGIKVPRETEDARNKRHEKKLFYLQEIAAAVKKAGFPYEYVAVDTITGLEELCIPYAEDIYSRTSQGKNWFKKTPDGKLAPDSGKMRYRNIINMPNGAGYKWTRDAFTKAIDLIKKMAPKTILIGHIKDTLLEKNGAEFNALDLDLTGKLKRITSSQSDAIGYLYRKGNNQNILSFKTSDEVSCGARPRHLQNKEILISEKQDDGSIKTFWDEIYID